MEFKGRVWKFGDDIDTDVIIAARYLHSSDPDHLGKHCMEAIKPGFSDIVKHGDIIVAGKNFGCGSSREHAPISIKACGISVVIAKSFARIFFRNAINIGLPVIETPDFSDYIDEGDEILVDVDKGEIGRFPEGKKYGISAFPSFLQNIISMGGLMNYVLKQ